MYRPTLRRQALRLGLLATLVVLALNACTGGGQEQADRPRPLPEDEKALLRGVQTLTFLQGRQGLVKHTIGSV